MVYTTDSNLVDHVSNFYCPLLGWLLNIPLGLYFALHQINRTVFSPPYKV